MALGVPILKHYRVNDLKKKRLLVTVNSNMKSLSHCIGSGCIALGQNNIPSFWNYIYLFLQRMLLQSFDT